MHGGEQLARQASVAKFAIEHRWKVLVASLVFLVLGGFLFTQLRTSFFPDDVQYWSYAGVWLPNDANFEATNHAAQLTWRCSSSSAMPLSRSWCSPAAPYGVAGALIALWVMNTSFGFMAFLGIASLIGVIVSHVIVRFDFIEEMHAKGEPFEQAVIDAGIIRLRPVMITVGATVLALFPLAMHGGPLW